MGYRDRDERRAVVRADIHRPAAGRRTYVLFVLVAFVLFVVWAGGHISAASLGLGVLGAAVAGFVLARVLRSTSGERLRIELDVDGRSIVIARLSARGRELEAPARVPLVEGLRFVSERFEDPPNGSDMPDHHHRIRLLRGDEVVAEIARFQNTPWDAAVLVRQMEPAMQRLNETLESFSASS